jgi:hypothetical protein
MPLFDPAAFHEVFQALNALPIVGGQAVNVWAELYLPREPALREFIPFLSKDADLFGERAQVQRGPPPPGWIVAYYSDPRQSAVALLTKELAEGRQLRVEVMRAVHGLDNDDLRDATLVEVAPGRVYRLPSPLRLLKAKIANVHDLTRSERPQDLKHVRMLVHVCAAYLRDLHAAILSGEVPERSLINALQELDILLRSPKAVAIAAKHRVTLTPALPLDLRVDKLPKLAAFYAHQAADGDQKAKKRPARRK